MLLTRKYILTICYSLLISGTFAQQYPFVNYTPKEGLVNNRARFTFQDSKGRLYISTYGGMSIYDGTRFTNYTTENGLAASLVNQVIEMGDDSLWIIPNAGGLHCLVNGRLRNFPITGVFIPVINQLLKCSDGFYYAVADEGLFRFEKNRFIKIPLLDPHGKEAGIALTQAVEKDKKLFMITDMSYTDFPGSGRLLIYDFQTRNLSMPEGLPGFYFIVSTPQQEIWLSSPNGIKQIDWNGMKQDKLKLVPARSIYKIPENIPSSYLFFDRQQNLWLTCPGGIFECRKDGSNRFITPRNGLPVGNQTSIYQDRENTMWFTNEQSGLTKLANQQFEFYPEINPGFITTDIYADNKSDSVWFYNGNHSNALLYYKNKYEKYHISRGFSAFSRIIMGPRKAWLEDQSTIYELKILAQQHVLKPSLIHQNRDSVFPFGNPILDKNGNLITAGKKISVFTINHQMLSDSLNYFADQATVDRQGRIWTLNRSNKLFVYQLIFSEGEYHFQRVATYDKELPRISPRSVMMDSTGNLWVGTRDHGLFCFFLDDLRIKNWKQLTLKDGLSENFINYLHCDAGNNVWACSPTGLDKIKQKNGKYFIENVTRGNNIYQNIRKVQSDRQGTLWALTTVGVIRILPSPQEPIHYQPQPLLTDIVAGNEHLNDIKRQLSLSYQQNDISFHIAAPSFIDEKMTRFSYWLEGSGNTNWSQPSTQSEINFVNLSPGEYNLKVKAQFLNGQYPEQITSQSFIILPPWWQTWWFRILTGILVIGLLVLAVRFYYKRKLEKQRIALEKQQAIERERTRIATDMHDDLGAGLTRIKFLSETIADKIALQHDDQFELEKLKSSSNELVEKMGEIIWAMNEQNNTLEDLVFYLRSYAMVYCQENSLTCEFEVPGTLPQQVISGQLRRNVFLVLKESLHNVVKHAAARKVSIRMDADKSLTLIIHDDGKGLSNQPKKQTGNGLINIQKRAVDLNGTVKLENHEGVSLVLNIPL